MNRAFYVTGGTLKPDAPSYVERPADRELWDRIQAGDYCYVLTSRQMGKSSLMAHTAERLRTAGERAAIVDLTQIGSERDRGSAERWYFGVLHAVHRGLGVGQMLKRWWEENAGLTPVQRFVEYFREVALTESEERLVVFVDEIDSTIGLPFAGDFFAAIRACYNERANDAAFRRLSFVLLGVATPDQLISDPTRTPFNVGQRVELTDFTRDGAQRLASGLGEGGRGEQLLRHILRWTGGQPYLTQVLCHRMAEECVESGRVVDRVVEESFLSERALREETHLRYIRARLVDGNRGVRRQRLAVYRRIYRGKSVFDDPASPIVASLKLSGVVRVREDGALMLRNRLYERVFTADWAQREMPIDRERVFAYGLLVAVMAQAFVFFAVVKPLDYVEQLAFAFDDYSVAARAYSHLRRNPFYRWQANELMARFWERRARWEESRGDHDRALLNRFQALRSAANRHRRHEVWKALQDYEDLYGQRQVPLLQHESTVLAVAFSPNGTRVLTGSADGTARLWSATSGEALGVPMRHEDSVVEVTFSPDGALVLTGSGDGAAQLWSATSGKRTLVAPMRHDDWVRAVAFSPDGMLVLTGSEDSTARLWNVRSGEAQGVPMRHGGSVLEAAFSPHGTLVLTGSEDGMARLWNVTSGEAQGAPMRHEGRVLVVAFSPNGTLVLTGSEDGMARLWNVTSGEAHGAPMRHEDAVIAVAFSPDGTRVLTGCANGAVQLWNSTNGETIGLPMRHEGPVIAVSFSPDSSCVLIITHRWLYVLAVTRHGLKALNSRYIGAGWIGVHHFSDSCADCLDIAVHLTADSLAIETIHLFEPDAPPIEGDPDELLEEWQQRLGLAFDADMNIVPRR